MELKQFLIGFGLVLIPLALTDRLCNDMPAVNAHIGNVVGEVCKKIVVFDILLK